MRFIIMLPFESYGCEEKYDVRDFSSLRSVVFCCVLLLGMCIFLGARFGELWYGTECSTHRGRSD